MSKIDIKNVKKIYMELEKAPLIYHPSKFWVNLNKIHTKYLKDLGFENFKRSINHHYFNFETYDIITQHFFLFLREVFKGNFSPIFKSHFDNYDLKTDKKFNLITAFIYRIHVSTLFDFVSRIDKLNILNKLDEPLVGNPLLVKYKGKLISQDIINSVHEYYSICQKAILPKKISIVELGAGYGRLAFVFLKTLSDASYCIVDIPPALYVSCRYLKKVFPKEKIFNFRSFRSFKDVQREFESSRIRFLMPHQLELLPEKYFDLFINISSLHEMTKPQIKNYLKLINKLCKNYFYTKQWRKSRTKINFNIREKEYPIPKNWGKISGNSPHPIQNRFFDTLFIIK